MLAALKKKKKMKRGSQKIERTTNDVEDNEVQFSCEQLESLRNEAARESARRSVFKHVTSLWESRLLCSLKFCVGGYIDGMWCFVMTDPDTRHHCNLTVFVNKTLLTVWSGGASTEIWFDNWFANAELGEKSKDESITKWTEFAQMFLRNFDLNIHNSVYKELKEMEMIKTRKRQKE